MPLLADMLLDLLLNVDRVKQGVEEACQPRQDSGQLAISGSTAEFVGKSPPVAMKQGK